MWYSSFSFWFTSLCIIGSSLTTSLELTQMCSILWLSNIPFCLCTATHTQTTKVWKEIVLQLKKMNFKKKKKKKRKNYQCYLKLVSSTDERDEWTSRNQINQVLSCLMSFWRSKLLLTTQKSSYFLSFWLWKLFRG